MPLDTRYYSNKFNRGEIDDLATARDDITKVNNSASLMENFMPLRLGPMTYRPGTEYLNSIKSSAGVYMVPFVAATDDTALLEFTDSALRLWVNDTLVTTTGKNTSIANGTFDSNLSDWTDADESGAVSEWQTGGYMRLVGTDSTSAVRWQTTTGYEAGEHRLRIVVRDAPVLVELGYGGTAHSDDIFSGHLPPGTHSLVLNPTGNFDITLSNSTNYQSTVDSVSIEATGTFELPTNISTAQLSSIRYAQSADVIFMAWSGGPPLRIERRGVKSWSVTDYQVNDGPFGLINSSDITLTPSALSGGNTVTLTANKDYFKSTDVGALFRLSSQGQEVTGSVTAEDTGTNSIRVTGIETSRAFIITATGVTGNTVTLQRSVDDATWTDVETYTANQSKNLNDGFDNSILYYRLWVKTGDYAAGTITLSLQYEGGSIEGVARVSSFTSATVVNVNVIEEFGSTDATRNWYRDQWSEINGAPTAVALYEGRLWWAGRATSWGSVSDVFDGFDDTIEGDSASISKTIGFGPVENVEWLLPLNRLLMGIASDELSIRSNSFGDVLTPSNTNIKPGTSQGAAGIAPIRVNSRGYFVQRSLTKLYELDYTVDQDIHDGNDLTVLNPDICADGIKRIAVSMQPEIRIYVVLNSGDARVYLFDKTEDVAAWSRITTDGTYNDVVVLPGLNEDRVYFVVTRDGGTYLEKLALFSESKGANSSKHYDSFVSYSHPGTTPTGLNHLEGEVVSAWGDGELLGTYTVDGGEVTLPRNYADVVIGLPYTATYESSMLGNFTDHSVLTYDKRVVNVGFVLQDYVHGALTVGPSVSEMQSFPLIERGTVIPEGVQSRYNEKPFPFHGRTETDPRVVVQATAPTTILALTYGIEESTEPTYDQRRSHNQAN